MDRLGASEKIYSPKERVAAVLGIAALALGLGACGGKHEVSAQGDHPTTTVATETPGHHLSGENPELGEQPQGDIPAAGEAPAPMPPENIPEGGLPEITVPREDVENGNGAQPPVNPNGAYEPGPEAAMPDFPDIKNMIGSADAEGAEICFAGEGFRIDWDQTATIDHTDGYATPVGVGNCAGKGYPRLGHGWREEGNRTTVCLPAQRPDGIHYYIANAFGGLGDGVDKGVHVNDFGTQDSAKIIKNCNMNPGPEDVISW